MKSLKSLIIVLALVFAFKQTYSCLPDCENDQFQMEFTDIYLPICNETIGIDYGWRIACDTWYDYYISFVYLYDSDCLNNEFNGDINAMLEYIVERLIIENPANFPPQNIGECNGNWRVMHGSCWRGDIITGKIEKSKSKNDDTFLQTVYDVLAPCTYNDCCLEYIEVCINQNGDRIITFTDYLPPEDPTCMDPAPYDSCTPVCGSIYNR